MTPSYVELHARSALSFLRGASQPEDLLARAKTLGFDTMALTDRDGLYGAARFYLRGRECSVRAITGAELTLDDGSVLPVLVATRTGYQNLSRLITRAKLRGTKHDAPVHWAELAEFAEGLVALTGDEEGPIRRALVRDDRAEAQRATEQLVAAFGKENVFVEIQRHLRRGEERENDALADLADALHLPLLATNGVLHAAPDDRRALDVFTCARHHTHLDAAGRLLSLNAERHLKSAAEMAELFADRPHALANTVRLAERLEFTLQNLGYEFPRYRGLDKEQMTAQLRTVAFAGARARYSHLSGKVLAQLNEELGVIAKLGFSGYFLIVWDIVNFCTEHGIMVQGRGSAANSVVCYALGITACDPIERKLLFERFLAEGRETWPDIDLDLPSGDRRERVIQEMYRRYGREGAAMTANVITFRGRSAMREIGKALNFSPDVLDRFSRLFANGDFPHTLSLDAQLAQSGLAKEHPRALAAIDLYRLIHRLPRHLGQHSGGMIICQGQLDRVVPLENASMPGRVVAQWDKDDCADLGIIKVDLLGLGMMSAMQDAFEMCAARGRAIELHRIPHDDAATFELMCAADTIGTFQVESRAQMATLPRLRPKEFYDVAIQVAIIRPGPIEGDMVNPYLARRCGKEEPTYYGDKERLEPVLGRTLGVPLFQEQLLKMAMVMANFSGAEAEKLRRALSFHRSHEKMDEVCVTLRERMAANGIAPAVIDDVTKAVQSFAVYGFPESHAISFALIAYASCWMKVHRAPEFYAALLNNQPMGFYSPSTLVLDAKRRGVRIRPVNVTESEWLCTIEGAPFNAETQRPQSGAEDLENPNESLRPSAPRRWNKPCEDVLRLGLCYVRGLSREHGERIVAERKRRAFESLADFQLRTVLPQAAQRALAKAGALNGLAEHRRAAQWRVEVQRDPDDLFAHAEEVAKLPLTPMAPGERVKADFATTGLTTGPHPMALVRARLPDVWLASELAQAATGTRVRVAGMVICRQRPGTAKGFVFVSLEDETGVANAVVAPQLFERYRLRISEEAFLLIEGVVQNIDHVIHVKAELIEPLACAGLEAPASHDFH